MLIIFLSYLHQGIANDRLEFLRRNYDTEKRKILQTYENDMIDYKKKKFQLQKELESVYYGLADRSLKQTKTAEEDFLQRQDELKNSVRFHLIFILSSFIIHANLLTLKINSSVCAWNLYLAIQHCCTKASIIRMPIIISFRI